MTRALKLTAVALAGAALLMPGAASAAYFPQLEETNNNPMDAFYRSQQASQQAELNRLQIERQRLELERQRSQSRDVYCRLPDGRFVQC